MIFMRMGVGVGEASLSPSAYSLITDYFPKERLATAISFYSMGIYIGSGMAFLLGGIVVRLASVKEAWLFPIVGAVRPWQVIFFVVGLPGLLFALLLYTVREPLRRGIVAHAARVPMREVFAYIFKNKSTFLSHNIGFGLLSLVSYSAAAWVPEYFRRVHHWDIPTVGVVYGSIVAIFGSLGILSAGYVADWLRGRGVMNANMRVGACIGVLWIPVHFLLFLAPTGTWATVWLVPAAIFAGAPFGISAAAIQQMMPNPMRGQAAAVYLFILNLVGLGIGPTAVGFTTQHIFGRDDAVGYSLLIVSVAGSVAGAVLLWLGSKPFLKSLDCLKEWAAEN
jgi:MFS family permease